MFDSNGWFANFSRCEEAAERVQTDLSASYVSSAISGPIRVSLSELTGAYTGLNQASVSGLSYSAIVRAAGTRYGISVECDTTLSVSNVAVAIAYAPYSGVIDTNPSLSYAQLNPSASASCSNSLDYF